MTLACLVVCFNLLLLSTLSVCTSLLFWIHNGCPFLLLPELSQNALQLFWTEFSDLVYCGWTFYWQQSSSKGSINSSICNLLSSCTVLIWLEIVTSEAFLFDGLHDLISSLLMWTTVEDVKSRSQKKHVNLCSNFSSLISHETRPLFQCIFYHFPASKLSLPSHGCLLCMFSLSCSLRNTISRNSTFVLLQLFIC